MYNHLKFALDGDRTHDLRVTFRSVSKYNAVYKHDALDQLSY